MSFEWPPDMTAKHRATFDRKAAKMFEALNKPSISGNDDILTYGPSTRTTFSDTELSMRGSFRTGGVEFIVIVEGFRA